MTERSENRTIVMTENGKRSYSFTAPIIEGYSLAKNPYQEFRDGIKMVTYTSDSLSLEDATITANYAIYYDKQKLWEAKGNVVIVKKNRKSGDTIVTGLTEVYTQQLFWDARTKKIYSNVDTKVLQPDGWHFGVGFEADEDLKNIHFRKYKSEMEFDFSPVEESADDKGADKGGKNEGKSGSGKDDKRPRPGGRPTPRDSKATQRGGTINTSMSTFPSSDKSMGPGGSSTHRPQRPQTNKQQVSLSTSLDVKTGVDPTSGRTSGKGTSSPQSKPQSGTSSKGTAAKGTQPAKRDGETPRKR